MTSEETTFWISFISIASGMFVITLKYCLRSKCDNVSICYGLLNVHRNTEQEVQDVPDTPTLARQFSRV